MPFVLALLLAANLLSQPAGEPERAEYAVRWDVEEGGPRTAKKVLEVLGKEGDESTKYEIRYYDFTPLEEPPAGFTSILRERKTGDAHELTFKNRGDHPLAGWECPFAKAESKEEVDVSILAGGRTKRSYSYSCTRETRNGSIWPPLEWQARARDCVNKMRRIEAGKLKIEEWHLPGRVVLLEVSRNGANTADDLESFQRDVVDKLLAAGVQPSDRSKTEIGSSCARTGR